MLKDNGVATPVAGVTAIATARAVGPLQGCKLVHATRLRDVAGIN